MLILLPEIGTLERKQVTGPLPALVAMRFNPDLKAKYDALRHAQAHPSQS